MDLSKIVRRILRLRDQGLTYKDIDAVLGWDLRSYRVMRTPRVRRYVRMLGI